MGRSYIYTYVVFTGTNDDKNLWRNKAGWNNKSIKNWGYGAPNVKNLKRYLKALHDSISPEGINKHLIGILEPPTWARIERQSTGEVIVEVTI